jgi:RNA polymerase sigma-70 factor (ECF subfamily)
VGDATDAQLIARSLEEPQAFAAVFDRHASVVFRFLIRRVGRDGADELLGETFRIAFERRDSYDVARANARPWLYGIASNLVARRRRSDARRWRATSRLEPSPPADPFDADLVAGLDARRRWPIVAAALAALPDIERDTLLLHAWEELSYEEIAVALDIPVGTVRSRLNRARRRLRELVLDRGEEPVDNCTQPSTRTMP